MTGHTSTQPSDWIEQRVRMHGRGGVAWDLAAGSGRHSRLLQALGYEVHAVDRNPELGSHYQGTGIHFHGLDLEATVWPFSEPMADLLVVSNYLFRPRLEQLPDLLRPGGLLIYETFGRGNARFGKPSNPDYLLNPGELESLFCHRLDTIETFFGEVQQPMPAVRARYCGRRDAGQ